MRGSIAGGSLFRAVRAGLPIDPASASWEEGPAFQEQLVKGEVAFRRRDWPQAVELLTAGIDAAERLPLVEIGFFPEFYQASESLATAWQRIGNETSALRVLETAAQTKAQYPNLLGAVPRFHVQARLAREYRTLGRIDEAVAIEDDVLHMLRYADADNDIVRQIREARAGTSVEAGQ